MLVTAVSPTTGYWWLRLYRYVAVPSFMLVLFPGPPREAQARNRLQPRADREAAMVEFRRLRFTVSL